MYILARHINSVCDDSDKENYIPMKYELYSKDSMFMKYLNSQHNFGHITWLCCHADSVNMWTLVSSLDDGAISLDHDMYFLEESDCYMGLSKQRISSLILGDAILHHAALNLKLFWPAPLRVKYEVYENQKKSFMS